MNFIYMHRLFSGMTKPEYKCPDCKEEITGEKIDNIFAIIALMKE